MTLQFFLGLALGAVAVLGYFLENWKPMTARERKAAWRRAVEHEKRCGGMR